MDQDLYSELIKGIDEENAVGLLKTMIAIKSENPFLEEPRPGYREKEMAEFLAEQMRSLGLEVTWKEIRPGRPNVFGSWKGTGAGKTLMLAGHMDTARTEGYPDAYEAKVVDGKVYGRGSCDMKAALAAYLEVARLLKEAKVKLQGHLIIGGSEWTQGGPGDHRRAHGAYGLSCQ
jgi:acetylornithine deacetylase/succinyl-diaminopimelate desuccinylase-like protein